jgi:hypothetical protein
MVSINLFDRDKGSIKPFPRVYVPDGRSCQGKASPIPANVNADAVASPSGHLQGHSGTHRVL